MVKRYRTDEKQDYALVEELAAKGGTLDLSNPLPPPAIELIILTRN
jgi:hypothetical protein